MVEDIGISIGAFFAGPSGTKELIVVARLELASSSSPLLLLEFGASKFLKQTTPD